MVPYPWYLNLGTWHSWTVGDTTKVSWTGHFHFWLNNNCSKNYVPVISYLCCQDHHRGTDVPHLME